MSNINPFGITKAAQLTDIEINSYWVDVPGLNSGKIGNILNPKDKQSIYILGGKGCGKTHLLRHFSYPAKKNYYKNDISNLLDKEGYIGIYFLLSSLNSSRFSGCNVPEEVWLKIFQYYIDIFLSQKLLLIFEEYCIEQNPASSKLLKFCELFSKLISKKQHGFQFKALRDITSFLNEIQQDIDYRVNNAAFLEKESFTGLEILFNNGELLFQIPKLLSTIFNDFKEINFIYILDELEKLEEFQKPYINTLVWETELPTTIWVGARNYGFTTRKTCSGELIKQGSEYDILPLDVYLREDEDKYKTFAIKMCNQRLERIGINKNITEIFDKEDEQYLISTLAQKGKRNLPHIKQLKSYLENQKNLNHKEISEILENISDKNALHSKYKAYAFYKVWNDKDIIQKSDDINKEFQRYLNNEKCTQFDSIVDHYKSDFVSQLLVESKKPSYLFKGISLFIETSWCCPRSLLMILRNIFQWAIYNGEDFSEENISISINSQSKGLYKTSKWFLDDIEIQGEIGLVAIESLNKIASLLKAVRFSEKPSECSVSSVSIKSEALTNINVSDLIRYMVNHSIVIEHTRKDKNFKENDKLLQINRMLCPLWDLPYSRRGILSLNTHLINSIFSLEYDTYKKIYNERINSMRPPFSSSTDHFQPKLGLNYD